MNNNNIKRPPLLISNSSWYLIHYRKLLISELKNIYSQVVTLSPIDKSSSDLSKISLFIPWHINRSKSYNVLSLSKSLIKLTFLIRAIKPGFIHSHTLLSNLLVAFVGSIFSIPTVLSFPGLGKLKAQKGINNWILIFILKIIVLLSFYSRISKLKFRYSTKRSIFIFQNNVDLQFFKSRFKKIPTSNLKLIYGSGVPTDYLKKKIYNQKNNWLSNEKKKKVKPNFIYCARLLESKGILTFVEIAKLLPDYKFLVFGDIDPSSEDSLTLAQVNMISKSSKNITFYKNKKDPLKNLKVDFPILIVPSNYGEGFPRGVAEAIVLNYPVIISSKASCQIFDKNDVYIANKDDPKSYLESFEKILEDFNKGIISPKLENSREKVIKNFSEKIVVNKTLKLYQALLMSNKSTYFDRKNSINPINWIAP